MSSLVHRHPQLGALSDDLSRSGKWQQWCDSDARLAGLESLQVASGLHRRDRHRARFAVAALVELGCRRGGDDDEAALAVVVMLADALEASARRPGWGFEFDEYVSAMWEAVKQAGPSQGPAAAGFLVKETCRLVVPPHARPRSRHGGKSRPMPQLVLTDQVPEHQIMPAAGHSVDDDLAELLDLLVWGRTVGVLTDADVEIVREFVAYTRHPEHLEGEREHWAAAVAKRHGLARKSVDARRRVVIRRLQENMPAYLAATA